MLRMCQRNVLKKFFDPFMKTITRDLAINKGRGYSSKSSKGYVERRDNSLCVNGL